MNVRRIESFPLVGYILSVVGGFLIIVRDTNGTGGTTRVNITTEHRDEITIVHAEGRLDFGNAKSFQSAIEPLFEQTEGHTRAIVVNCSQLEYISSAGLRVFLVGAKLANKNAMGFTVCNLSPLVKDVFDISGFGNIMPICSDLESALITVKDT